MAPPLPDVDHPVAGLAADMGWCMAGQMGAVPLTASEIAAWAGLSGCALTPWEFGMVSRMSAAFCAGSRAKRAPYKALTIKMAMATASFMGA